MSLSLWNDTNPWSEMRRLESEMDKLFSIQPSQNNQQVWFRPALDIKETETEYKIHAELPGLEK